MMTVVTIVVMMMNVLMTTRMMLTASSQFSSGIKEPPPCRAGPSPWLALWYGMVSHWLSGHLLGYSPRNSFSNLKQHYLATGSASE